MSDDGFGIRKMVASWETFGTESELFSGTEEQMAALAAKMTRSERPSSYRTVSYRAQRRGAGVSFAEALTALRDGRRIARAGWNGPGMWLMLVTAAEWSVTPGGSGHQSWPQSGRLPWIALKTVDHGLVPWVASQTDLLADDWQVVS